MDKMLPSIKNPIWKLGILIGFVIHLVGLIRLFPILKDMKMPEFAVNYYIPGWAIRLGFPVYDWSKTVEMATAFNIPKATLGHGSFGCGYPPLFVFLVVPFSFLPYELGRILWSMILLSIGFVSAWLLTKIFALPFRLVLILTLFFSPFTFAWAFCNVSPMLLLGLVALAAILVGKFQSIWSFLPFTLIAYTKLFPFSWVLIPLMSKQLNILKKIAILTSIMIILTIIISPKLTVDFWGKWRDGGVITDILKSRRIVGHQMNIFGLVNHLTQPVIIDYHKFGIYCPRTISPLLPLSTKDSKILGWGIVLLVSVIILIISWRLIIKGFILQALWFFTIGIVLVLPLAEYPYFIVSLPAFLYLFSSPSPSSWLGVIAYNLLGMARFFSFLTFRAPSPLSLLTAQLGTLAMLFLLIGIFLSVQQKVKKCSLGNIT